MFSICILVLLIIPKVYGNCSAGYYSVIEGNYPSSYTDNMKCGTEVAVSPVLYPSAQTIPSLKDACDALEGCTGWQIEYSQNPYGTYSTYALCKGDAVNDPGTYISNPYYWNRKTYKHLQRDTENDVTICTACPSDTYNDGTLASCAVCPAGSRISYTVDYYSGSQRFAGGGTSCTPCTQGTYEFRFTYNPELNVGEQSWCWGCEGNKEVRYNGVHVTSGGNECVTCAAGYENVDRINSGGRSLAGGICTICGKDKASTSGGDCNACPDNTQAQADTSVGGVYVDSGAQYCVDCPPGSDNLGGGPCDVCGTGKPLDEKWYSPGNRQTCVKTDCDIEDNEVANDVGGCDCIDDPNIHEDAMGSCVCNTYYEPIPTGGCRKRQCVCPNGIGAQGEDCSSEGDHLCTSCTTSGYYLNGTQCSEWTTCEPGQMYQHYPQPNSTLNRVCLDCVAGKYSETNNSPWCYSCPAGKGSSAKATSCEFCGTGKYSSDIGQECTMCDAGYYPVDDNYFYVDENATHCVQCPINSTNGQGAGQCECIEGYGYALPDGCNEDVTCGTCQKKGCMTPGYDNFYSDVVVPGACTCNSTNAIFNGAGCVCGPGYSGDNCEGDICTTGKDGKKCQNGGSVTGTTGSCGCDCVGSGYAGPHCEIAIDVDVRYDGKPYKACENDAVNVIWNGHHNIQEVLQNGNGNGTLLHGFELNGHEQLVSGLTASPGQTRYFVCTEHPESNFSTYCPEERLGCMDVLYDNYDPNANASSNCNCYPNAEFDGSGCVCMGGYSDNNGQSNCTKDSCSQRGGCIKFAMRAGMGITKHKADKMVSAWTKPVTNGDKLIITESVRDVDDNTVDTPAKRRKRTKQAVKLIFADPFNLAVDNVLVPRSALPDEGFKRNSTYMKALQTRMTHWLPKVEIDEPLYAPLEEGDHVECEIDDQTYKFNQTSENETKITWPNGEGETNLQAGETVLKHNMLFTAGSIIIEAAVGVCDVFLTGDGYRPCPNILASYTENGCCGAADGQCATDVLEYKCAGCCSE